MGRVSSTARCATTAAHVWRSCIARDCKRASSSSSERAAAVARMFLYIRLVYHGTFQALGRGRGGGYDAERHILHRPWAAVSCECDSVTRAALRWHSFSIAESGRGRSVGEAGPNVELQEKNSRSVHACTRDSEGRADPAGRAGRGRDGLQPGSTMPESSLTPSPPLPPTCRHRSASGHRSVRSQRQRSSM